jgi:hypothetical protein
MIELCTCIDGYFLFTKSWPKGRIRNTVLEGLEMLIHFWVSFLSYFLIIFITRIKIITKIQLTQYSRLSCYLTGSTNGKDYKNCKLF